MKKTGKLYIAAWAVLFVVFNVIAFVSPGWEGQEKYTASFWIGYVAITLMMIIQLVCSLLAFRADSARKLFLNLPMVTISYTGMIVMTIIGALCMLLSPLPYWIGIIVCVIVLVVTVIAVVKAKAAADIVEDMDEKVISKTSFIKTMTLEAESLMNRVQTPEIKAELKKVHEAFRYSDPMSAEGLAEIENEIGMKFGELKANVKNGDADGVSAVTSELVELIKERNGKCKLVKGNL